MKQSRVQRFASYRASIQKMRASNQSTSWSNSLRFFERFFQQYGTYFKVILWSLLAILGVVVMALFFFGRAIS